MYIYCRIIREKGSSLGGNRPNRLIVVIVGVCGVRLLQASALVALDKVDLNRLDLLRLHLSPVQNNLRIVVLYFIVVDNLVSFESLQEVKVYLEACRDAEDGNDHAETTATTWLDNGCIYSSLHSDWTYWLLKISQNKLIGEDLAL